MDRAISHVSEFLANVTNVAFIFSFGRAPDNGSSHTGFAGDVACALDPEEICEIVSFKDGVVPVCSGPFKPPRYRPALSRIGSV